MPVQRADARRNYARILAVAEAEVAERGADASLERIARVAGVGSATVRRHFPSRRALLDAVFHEQVDALCTRAHELADAPDPRAALLEWLGALTAYAASARGLATALAPDTPLTSDAAHAGACAAKFTEALTPLLRRAAQDGAAAPDLTVTDLLTLVAGIAWATEHHHDAAAEADRLLGVMVAGVSPGR
ncbi:MULTISPECIES: TetR/AcrR family transcriptional regulator [unclassified Streptomyces]|uniref:TetR/AcrR family transcriptional regulator n=1 Tax=unclassified Streptomyces TaxID=2593676 RepID=UPI003810766C